MKFFRFLKKFFLFSFLLVAVVLGAGAILGYVYQDRIHLMAIQELEKATHARIELQRTDISFLRSWPNVTVELEELHVNPDSSNAPKELFSVKNAALTVDFLSFFSDNYEIKEVDLDRPTVNLYAGKDGIYNFESLLKRQNEANPEDTSSIRFALEHIGVKEGIFSLQDLSNPLNIRLNQIDLDVSGELYEKVTSLEGKGQVYVKQWEMDGVTWFQERWVALDTDLDLDFENGERYAVKDGELRVEKLILGVSGNVARAGDDYDLNLDFVTNENSFESFLSLLPPKILDTGHPYQYAGDFNLNGNVRGLLGPSKMPSVTADYQVRNGSLQYEGYSARLTGITLDGQLDMRGEEITASSFTIDSLSASLHDRIIRGEVSINNFDTPLLAFHLKGDVNLKDFKDFYPNFADSTEVEGILSVDFRSTGLLESYTKQDFAALKNQGWMETEGLQIDDARVRYPVENLRGRLEFNNAYIAIPTLKGKAGKTEFDLYGRLDNYMAYVFDSTGYLNARLKVKAGDLNLNDWFAEEEIDTIGLDLPEGEELPLQAYDLSLPHRIDLAADLLVDRFQLEDLKARNLNGEIRWRDDHLDVPHLTAETMEGRAHVAGSFDFRGKAGLELNTLVTADNIQINEALKNFRKWADFTTMEDHLFGRFSGQFSIDGEVDEYLELQEQSLFVQGHADLVDGQLYDYEPLEELAGFVKMEKLKDVHFSSITSTFEIRDGYFMFPELFINANDYKFYLQGRHGLFNDSLDYVLHLVMPKLIAKKSRSKEMLDYIEVEQEEAKEVILPILIGGTVDEPEFFLDKKYVKETLKESLIAEREEVKEALDSEVEYLFGEQDTTEVDDYIEIVEDPNDKPLLPEDWVSRLKTPFRKKKASLEKPDP